MKEDTFSIKEMIERVEKKLDANTSLTADLANKVGIQNGRVTAQEKWSKDAQIIIENNSKMTEKVKDEYIADKAWLKGATRVIIGIAIIVPLVCTTIFGLYIQLKDIEIDKKIDSKISAALLELNQQVK